MSYLQCSIVVPHNYSQLGLVSDIMPTQYCARPFKLEGRGAIAPPRFGRSRIKTFLGLLFGLRPPSQKKAFLRLWCSMCFEKEVKIH